MNLVAGETASGSSLLPALPHLPLGRNQSSPSERRGGYFWHCGGDECFPSVQKYMVCTVQTGSWACSESVLLGTRPLAMVLNPLGLLKSTQATRQGHNCLLTACHGALAGLKGNMILIKTRSSHQNMEIPALGALAGTPASLHWRAVLRVP